MRNSSNLEKIFELSVIVGIHISLRDRLGKDFNSIEKTHLESTKDTVIEILELYKPFLNILDKQVAGEEALNIYTTIFQDKKLSDKDLIVYVDNQLNELEEEDKKVFFDAILLVALKNDNRISIKEKQLLGYFYEKLSVSDKGFEEYEKEFLSTHDNAVIKDTYLNVEKTKEVKEEPRETKDETQEKEIKSENRKNKKGIPKTLIGFAVLSILLLVAVFIVYSNSNTANRIPKPPSIVFKKIFFNRYVAAGNTYTTDNKLFRKLVVFYLKGEADIQFDTRNLTLQKDEDGWIAVYRNPDGEGIMPFGVDVSIDPNNYYEVLNVQPELISESEAAEAGKVVGFITGSAGALFGAKVGSNIGSAVVKTPIVGGIAGALVGGAGGGLLAGAGGYVMTKKFLTGVQLSPSIDQGDKDKILEKAKALIAAELLFDESLSEQMRESFIRYVKGFYGNFNIDVKQVVFE